MFEDTAFLYVEDDAPSRQVMNLVMKRIMQVPHLATFQDSIDFIARLKALDPPPTVFFAGYPYPTTRWLCHAADDSPRATICHGQNYRPNSQCNERRSGPIARQWV